MSTLNNKVFTKPKHYNFWDVSVFADNMIYIHRQSKYADINESLLTHLSMLQKCLPLINFLQSDF